MKAKIQFALELLATFALFGGVLAIFIMAKLAFNTQ